ncbi:MAG TPA: 3-hydroxyacyl-ACP dehydratase FabZ family protein [Gemmataceae bacterium]|jgi:3-hydroxyacyl-[acyl-carrier-protein] dehydratase|nr:3-hydroxyacyl-ACP dehydratase FabZ family protein [Gemmataceae bacterium]
MRWIWIDRFLEFEKGKSAKAVKNLSLAEDYFADHFPGYPLMPGSLMLEGLAQTGGILVGDANDFREKVVLAKVPYVRYHQEVFPGSQLIYEVTLLHLRPEGAAVEGRVRVADSLVAEAEIFFAHLDHARSQQLFGDHNFVFSGELQHLLGLAKAIANRTDAKSTT